jgi:hypothetical protein
MTKWIRIALVGGALGAMAIIATILAMTSGQ